LTIEISFHSLAERELNEAASFYDDRSKGLGKSFLNEIERTLDLIRKHPLAAALVTETVRYHRAA